MSSIMGSFEDSVRGLLGENEQWAEGTSTDDQLRALFDLLAQTNPSGDRTKITFDALREGFQRMSLVKSKEEITRMFELSDKDHSGAIEWSEFKTFFRHLVTDIQPCDDDMGIDKLIRSRKEGIQPSRCREWPNGMRPLIGYNVTYFAGVPSRVRTLCCSPNRPLLAVAEQESSDIFVYDTSKRKLVRIMMGHRESVVSISMSPDKKFAASTARDSTLILWDMTVGCTSRELAHPGIITCCAFSPDGKFIVTGCQDNVCRKYLVSRGKLLRVSDRLPHMSKGVIVSIAYQSVGGNTLAITRSHEPFVRILSAISFIQMHALRGHTTTVWDCMYSTDGNRLMSHCDKFIKIWDPMHRDCLDTYDVDILAQGPSHIWTSCSYVSKNFEHLLAAVTSESTMYFINLTDHSIVLTIGIKYPVYCISSMVETDSLGCGDDCGNLFTVDVW
ncbi:Vegetative incompatibility protein HET-E-1 [Diplonema papillatum]|nr:Vegetative incompatibility protein HET-E-1 [Diplonema papillatum]